MMQTAPYGSWKSPITSDLIVQEMIGLSATALAGGDAYWIELRPTEGGRLVIVRRTPDGKLGDVNPPPFNARTRVHEYGGGSYVIAPDAIYFSNYNDQRIYRQAPGEQPQPVSPDQDLRYADYAVDAKRGLLYAVREDHRGEGEAVNTLVALRMGAAGNPDGGRVIVSGNNFYSDPRPSPDGTRLAWMTWNHPNMPWDGTELWVGELNEDGSVGKSEQVAGGPTESIFQPQWSPDGVLYFISDRSGWWNLYRLQDGKIQPIAPMEAEFGTAQWVFGLSTYAFENAERLICTYSQHGKSHLALIDTADLELAELEVPYTYFGSIRAAPGRALFLAGSPTQPMCVVLLDLASGHHQVLRRSTEIRVDPAYISIPEEIEFPTEGGRTAHGIFYPPRNRDYRGPESEKPPLLVMSHGGPTGAATTVFNNSIQYWTSRGIAVLDVNYGGSIGYGREYRERLLGNWGLVDVQDCVNGARYLAERGLVDGNRLMITGGSAGGYTTLAALTFSNVFRLGASHFGIGDLETFVYDTHKYESHYLETLVGPFPQERAKYVERSPIHYLDNLNAPLILFQGLEDKIVPPNQAEMMYEAVRKKGLPVAYLPFEGEQHGFRRAENIKRSLDGQLYFIARVFGFDLAEPVEPVPIENLD